MSQSFPNLGRKMVGNEKMRRSRKVRRGYAWTIGLWAAVFIGLAMIAYPRFEDRAKEREQLELLSDWSLRIQAAPQPVRAEAPKPSAPPAAAAAAEKPLPQWKKVDGLELLGSIRIDSIDLVEPIVKGADAKALLKGAGTVVEGRLPGQTGNFVLAGHRSWTKGRHFNRLGELAPGDEIDVDTTAGTYRYVVTGTKVVEPEELSVLDQTEDRSILTLITCTPIRKATHRLIVTAELREPAV